MPAVQLCKANYVRQAMRGPGTQNLKRGFISMFALAATAGCAGLPLAQISATTPAPASCVCETYFEQIPRPAWVDAGDVVTRQTYQTSGSSQCSGLQSIDVNKADLSARTKLGRILNTQVSSNISETRTSYGGGVGSTKASIQSSLLSEGILENSRITNRWVDPGSCRVYARVQIAASQIEASKEKIAKAEAARLLNQTFYLHTQDNEPAYRDLVASAAGQLLSSVGVTKIIPTAEASAYQIKFTFAVTQLNAEKSMRGELRTQILAPDASIVWQQATPAKGLSFSAASNRALADKAIASAMRSLSPVLRNRLNQ